MKRSVVVFGGGNLGYALARGIEADPPPFLRDLTIVEHNQERREFIARGLTAQIVESLPPAPEGAILIVAVKPSDVAPLCTELRDALPKPHLVISCAAGISLSLLQSLLGCDAKIARCMPNLAASCRRAITAYVAGEGVSLTDARIVEDILTRVGTVVRLNDEDQLHTVTAISGSGPGYLAWIAEVMERAAIELGLPPETSRLLVQHTFDGVAHLLVSEEVSPRTICERVSSPQGTTVAAIRELSERGVDEALIAAIGQAVIRSRQLA